jgi:hypothetical protein
MPRTLQLAAIALALTVALVACSKTLQPVP